MAQVGSTRTTRGLGAYSAETVVGAFIYEVVADGFPETGPSTACVELGGALEEGLTADDTAVGAGALVVPVLACERRLGTGFLGAVVLQGCQTRAEFIVGLIGGHGAGR